MSDLNAYLEKGVFSPDHRHGNSSRRGENDSRLEFATGTLLVTVPSA